MTIKSGIKISLMLAVFVFISFFDMSVNQTYAQKCEDVTDEQIVEYMYAKMKENKQLAPQISHINVISKYRAIRFQGWVASEDDYKRLEKIGLGNFCITLINPSVNDLARKEPEGDVVRGGLCSGGTKACGDICIPENDICNITGFKN